MQIADDTAALLTASAYGPLSPFAFVSPGGSGTGLGTFARVRLQPGQAVGEFGGPRLPLRMCVRPSPQGLPLPALNLFIDGASENAPFACSSLPAVHVRRARRPNARLELWPVPRASANEVRQLVMLVAIAPVDAGAELRISDEPPQGLGFAAGLDGAAAWRETELLPRQLTVLQTAPRYRRVPTFSPYGSVCCACAQRPDLPRAHDEA
jgi:hypothetical protein